MKTPSHRADRYSPLVTVLVVDSDASKVRALALPLRECGYRVLEATSFPDAIRLWDAEEPQVLVADVRLEAFNGLQLVIRARAARPDVTAIVTSPVADRVLADETRRVGGTFLVKPVVVDEIVAAIEHRVPVARYERRVSIASLIYREFHDDSAVPASVKPQASASDRKAPTAPPRKHSTTLVPSLRHSRH